MYINVNAAFRFASGIARGSTSLPLLTLCAPSHAGTLPNESYARRHILGVRMHRAAPQLRGLAECRTSVARVLLAGSANGYAFSLATPALLGRSAIAEGLE